MVPGESVHRIRPMRPPREGGGKPGPPEGGGRRHGDQESGALASSGFHVQEVGFVPRGRLSMRRVSEVLRLAAQGLSLREISRSLRIGHTTAREYLERARRAGLSWPLPPELSEAELEARLFPNVTVAAESRPMPDWLAVHKDLKRSQHVTLKLLWLEHREVHPDGLGYSQFCARYQDWAGRQDVVMRLSYPAGERMFVDFCGDTVPVVNRETGEIRQAQVFVAALG